MRTKKRNFCQSFVFTVLLTVVCRYFVVTVSFDRLEGVMAKKEGSESLATKKRGRPATGKNPLAVQVRGSTEWKAWLEGVANQERTRASGLIDRALAEFAEKHGHPKPPKR